MKDLARKVAVGIATGALALNSVGVPAFAALNINVSGNGSNSTNNTAVTSTNTNVVAQTNDANISNNIGVTAQSGQNSANDNTGGDVSVDTGKAQAVVEVNNAANSNSAHVGSGGSPADVSVNMSGNGTESDNNLDLGIDHTTFVTQDNVANILNSVGVEADSGENEADDNTGGDVEISTGRATGVASITNQANSNVAHVGGGEAGELEIIIDGNGSNSTNDLALDLLSSLVLSQTNDADVDNNVGVTAESGQNSANDNTGGDTSVDTGNAEVGVELDTMVNFNAASVEDAGEFDGEIKIAGNGTESLSELDLVLASLLAATQDNVFDCDGGQGCNNVGAGADSGENEADDNTAEPDGDPSVTTGDSLVSVAAETSANTNVLSTGDNLPGNDWEDWFDFDSSSSSWMGIFMGLMGNWSN